MEEDYLNLSIQDLYDELINYNISLRELASIYKFPSVKDLEKAIRNYCKEYELKIPKQIEAPEEFFAEDEIEIYKLRAQGISLKKISEQFHMSEYLVRKTLEKMPTGIIDKNKSFDLEAILKDLNEGKTYSYIERIYKIPRKKLKELLSNSEEGQEIMQKKAEYHARRQKDIPYEEAVSAFLESDYTKYSSTTIRKRLRSILGDDYSKILRGDITSKITEDIVGFYMEGYTPEEMIEKVATELPEKYPDGKPEEFKLTVSTAKNRIDVYYKNQKIEKPKVLSQAEFEKYMSEQSQFDIESAVSFFEGLNIHVPERFIKSYLEKIGEVDLRKVKKIVRNELSQLHNEGKEPNFISPFEFAKKVKAKGYNTKYQATALLYQVIIDNDLSTDIASELDDKEIQDTLHLLVDYDKTDKIGFIWKLETNRIASVIYEMQNQASDPDGEKSIDD